MNCLKISCLERIKCPDDGKDSLPYLPRDLLISLSFQLTTEVIKTEILSSKSNNSLIFLWYKAEEITRNPTNQKEIKQRRIGFSELLLLKFPMKTFYVTNSQTTRKHSSSSSSTRRMLWWKINERWCLTLAWIWWFKMQILDVVYLRSQITSGDVRWWFSICIT